MKLPRRTFLRFASGAGAFRVVSRIGWAQAMIDPMHWQEELLALNPWARELWDRRRELVQRKQWNLYYIDQGGNDATRRWLAEFQTARHKASRERLEAGKVSWNVWAERISAVITHCVTRGSGHRHPGHNYNVRQNATVHASLSNRRCVADGPRRFL